MENPFARFTFPAALGLLCIVTVLGILLAFVFHHPEDSWAVAPVDAVLALLFLVDYAKRPGPEPRPARGPIPPTVPSGGSAAAPSDGVTPEGESATPPTEGDNEPFVDPVEEADRAEAEARRRAAAAEAPERSEPPSGSGPG